MTKRKTVCASCLLTTEVPRWRTRTEVAETKIKDLEAELAKFKSNGPLYAIRRVWP